MYFISIGIVIIANVLYSLFQNIIPASVNPAIALCCMYIGGLIFAIPFYIKNNKKHIKTNKNIWKRAIIFALINIVLDLGFFLAFKSGWSIGYFNIITNISILILLILIGLLFYKEKIILINFIGIIIGIIGLSILNL